MRQREINRQPNQEVNKEPGSSESVCVKAYAHPLARNALIHLFSTFIQPPSPFYELCDKLQTSMELTIFWWNTK